MNATIPEGSPRRLSQETTAVLSVGAALLAAFIALVGLILVSADRVADEARADRQALRAEMQAIREDLRAFRAEAQAERIAFAREIVRLTERQGHLGGLVEGLRERSSVPVAPSAAKG